VRDFPRHRPARLGFVSTSLARVTVRRIAASSSHLHGHVIASPSNPAAADTRPCTRLGTSAPSFRRRARRRSTRGLSAPAPVVASAVLTHVFASPSNPQTGDANPGRRPGSSVPTLEMPPPVYELAGLSPRCPVMRCRSPLLVSAGNPKGQQTHPTVTRHGSCIRRLQVK
jgi:hypothetical protein